MIHSRFKGVLLLLAALALFALPALAGQGETPAPPEGMTVAAAIVITLAIVQFVKEKLISSLWDKLGEAAKFVCTALGAIGVTLYKYLLKESLPLDLGAASFAVQVFIGAYFGYQILKGIAPTLSRTLQKKP